MITQKYKLNMIPDGNVVVVNVSQYDVLSRTVEMSLFSGSLMYEIPLGSTVTVRGTKADHTGFEYPCTFDDNVVTFDIEDQMTIFSGLVDSEIRIVNNGEIVGSANFKLRVEPTPLGDDTVISETQLPLLEEAIQASAEAQQYAEQAEESAEQAVTVLASAVKSVNYTLPDANGNVNVQTSSPLTEGSGIDITNDIVTNIAPMWVDEMGVYSGATPINADQLQGHPASYFATKTDLSLAQSNLADSEVSPSLHAYSVGQYLVYNGQLYKVTSAIAVNESLVVGSNIQAVALANQVKDIIITNPIDLKGVAITKQDGTGAYYSQAFFLLSNYGMPSGYVPFAYVWATNGWDAGVGVVFSENSGTYQAALQCPYSFTITSTANLRVIRVLAIKINV